MQEGIVRGEIVSVVDARQVVEIGVLEEGAGVTMYRLG